MNQTVPGALTLDGSNTLSATDGQSIQAGTLILAGDGSVVLVDADSTIEIGAAGDAAAGALTVDAGAAIDGTTTNDVFPAAVLGAVIDNGYIAAADLDFGNQFFFPGVASSGPASSLSGTGTIAVVAGGTIEVGGPITSGGLTLREDSGATLRLDAAVAAGNTVLMAGTGDVLRIGAPGATGLIAFGATIDGFGATDALLINGASITAAVASAGTLRLFDGTLLVGGLLVSGDFSGQQFVVETMPGGGVEIAVTMSGDAGGAGPGTGTPDHYRWIGPLAGDWGQAANWQDVTAGETPATIAPGSLDIVTIDGPDSVATFIGGIGAAASLTLAGDNAVTGTVGVGALTNIGPLVVAASGVLNAVTAATSADITVTGGFVVSAGLTLDSTSTLAATGGGFARVGALTAFGDGTGLSVDPGSILLVGVGTGAATGALTVANGATLAVTTPNTIFPTSIIGAVIDDGLISASELDIGWAYFFTGTIATGPPSSLSGSGTIEVAAGGTGEIGCGVAAGGLTLLVESGAVLRLDAPVGAGTTVSLRGDADVLRLGASGIGDLAGFNAVISGFGGADVVDAVGAEGATASVATNALGSTLALANGGTTLATLVFAGVGAGSLNFDPATGVVTACFAAGTRLATPRGPVRIEALRPGDPVLTLDGQCRPVRWLGHRAVICARHPRPEEVWPVRVRAGAFGVGTPSRDLFLSPDHAVFVRPDGAPGVLIPIRYLLNGASVARCPVRRVEYWHVELASHDIVLAEGLPVESYLDTGNRAAFANGGSVVMAAPDFSRRIWAERGRARLALGGQAVAATRAALIARLPALGFRVTTDPALRVLADGVRVEPQWDLPWLAVALPDETRTLRLISRATAPAFLDPATEDWRMLGVRVHAVRLDGDDLALDDPRLESGWHAPEGAWRWTDGMALIRVGGASVVELAVPPSGLAFAAASGTSSRAPWTSPAHAASRRRE